MNLMEAEIGREYRVDRLETNDEELESFLFSLGCYGGEPVTVVSRKRFSCVIAVKDSRYNIDRQLARAIFVA